MDSRLLGYYERELKFLREIGGEFAKNSLRSPAGCLSRFCLRRPLRGAAARRLRLSRGPRPPQARRRVPAVHPEHPPDHLSALSVPDAFDVRGSVPAGHDRAWPPEGYPSLECHRAQECLGRGERTGLRVPHRPRRDALSHRRRRGPVPHPRTAIARHPAEHRRPWPRRGQGRHPPASAARRTSLFPRINLDNFPLFIRGTTEIQIAALRADRRRTAKRWWSRATSKPVRWRKSSR